MGKIYFRDVSRRLLLFTLLLLGVVTQARAWDVTTTSNVIVFRDVPYTGGELLYEATKTDVKSLITVYQLTTTESNSSPQHFDNNLDDKKDKFKGKNFSEVVSNLGSLIDSYEPAFVSMPENITGTTEVKIKEYSRNILSYAIASPTYYYILNVGTDGKVKSFKVCEYKAISSNANTYTLGQIYSVTKNIDLPLYTFSVTDGNATVTTLKNDIQSKLSVSIRGINELTADEVKLHSATGEVTSDKLTAGTYTYKFKLVTPSGIKASFTRADGEAAPASVEPGQTNAEVEVSGSIVVTDKTVVTLKVPAKETLSFYEKEAKANVSTLGNFIATEIAKTIPTAHSANITVSNVRIFKAGSVQSGDLAATDYSYLFDVTVNSEDYIVNIERSNSESSGSTITPSRIDATGTNSVTVSNSIVIKPVLNGSVFSANYNTKSNQIQNEDALKQAILSGLSKKNQALKDDIYFENIQITGTPAYPLGAGTYSYTFDVRARKDLKIAFPESSTAEIKEIKLNGKSAFTVSDKIAVKKVSQSNASISFGSWSSYTYGTPLSGIESQITFTKVGDITGIEDCSVYFVKDGKETPYDPGKTVLPMGKYNVKVYFPASEIYDYSSVEVTGGTKAIEADGRVSFTSTGVLTIVPKAIGKTKLPVFTEGGDGLVANGTAVNQVIATIRTAIESADGTAAILAKNGIELYSDEAFTQKLTKGVLESGKTYSYRVILNENYKPGTQTEASVSGKLSANTSINGYDLKNAITATKAEIKVVLPDFISTPIKIGTITTKADLEKKVLDAVNNANSGLEIDYSFTPQVTTEAPLTSEGYLPYTITLKEGATHKLADYKITYQTQSSASDKLTVAADGVTCTFAGAIRFVTILPVEHAFTSPKNIPVDYVKDMKPVAITSLVSDKLYQLNGGALALTDKIQVTLLDKTGTAVKTVSESEAVYGYKVRVAKKSGVLEELYAGKADADVTIDNSDDTYIYVTVKNGIQLKARPVAEFNFPTYTFDYIVGETDEVAQILELIKRDLVYSNPNILLASYIDEITSNDMSVPEGGQMVYQVKFTSDLFAVYSTVTVNGEEVAEASPLSPQIAVTINPRADLTVNLKTYNFKKEGASDELMAQHIMADILYNNPNLKGNCVLNVTVENDGYSVRFAPTSKYRTITVKGADGTTLRTVNSAKAAIGFKLTYPASITLSENGGIGLIEIPMDIETELTYLNETFGYTAGHYARLILDYLNQHVTSTVANFVKPDLETWGVKVNIIRNQTQVNAGGTAELIPEDEYLKVSDLYGYQVVLTNPYFKNYYTLALKQQANMKVTEEVPGQTWNVLLSGTIAKKAVTPVLPTVTIDYADANTLAVVKAQIKDAVLSDATNTELFRLVAATGIQPRGSFSVELTADSPVPAGEYNYTLTFKPIVTENVEIAMATTGSLNVNKVKLEFEFPADITFKYEQKKKVMESKILEEFLAMNAGIFGQYADFANPGDIFTVTLKDAACTGEANDPIAAGTYGYVIKMKDAPTNFTYNIKADGKSMTSSVTVAQKSLTVKLPTYLLNAPDEIKPETQGKAVFVYGKTLSEIENQIKLTDIPALNKKLAAAEIQAVVLLGDDGAQTASVTPIAGVYDYKVILKSDNYTFKYDAAGSELETTTDGGVIVKGGLQIVEYPVTVGFSEANRSITGTWEIKEGKPVYSLSINWTSGDYGYDLLEISEEAKKTLTLERWKMYFNNDYLNWALVDTKNEIVTQDKSLKVVLETYVKANLTSGTYSLQVVKGGTEVPRLKSVVGDFNINLNTTLATLKVTPAVVKVNPEKASYTKEYGTEVTNADDFTEALNFATEPVLNGASLVDGFSVVDLFVTTQPEGVSVYSAYSPVGEYTIQTSAVTGAVGNAFTPVTGVMFEAGTTEAIVTVIPASMTEAVKLNVSVSREYGEDPVDSDIAVDVTGQDNVDANLVEQISAALNTAEGRVDWIDWASFNKKTNAGKYEIRFTAEPISFMQTLLPNFDMEGVAVTLDSLEIRKADLTVTAEDKNRVYGVANPELTIAYEGLKNNEFQSLDDVFDGDVLPAVATDATVSSRGSWEIYFTQQPTAKNYNVTYVTGNLSIDKIKRAIVWPEDQRNLTIAVGELVELSAAVTSADDNKLSITGLRYELTNNDRERVVLYQNENGKMMVEGKVRTLDGPVTITVYADGDETTYMDADPVTGTVTVIAPEGEAANVNIIVSNVTSVYDGTPRAVTVKAADKDGKEVDYKVFYEGDQTASTVYPSDQNAPVDAGTYKVTVKAEVGSTTFVYEAKNKMIIAPRVVEVKARSFTTTYGNTVPDYSKAYDYDKSDFLAGEDFDADKTPIVRAEAYKGNAGTYKLTPYSAQDFGKNYKVSYISGELVINKAPLTIIADNQESVYGKDLAELTYQLDGLVNGETIKNLGFAPRISSTVTKGADAGTYPIVFADNYESANYEVAYKEGKYVVVPTEQKICWNPETTYKLEQRDIPLTAMASSKLPVSYVSDNDAVAYVNQIGDNWILTLVSDGLVKIKAIQNGNTNYWAAEPVEVTFAIGNAYESVDNESIIVSDHIEVYPTVFTTNVTVAAPSAIKRVELVSYAGVLLKVFDKPESVINLSNFGKGFYLLNVTLEDGTFKSVKLIKK